MALTKNDIKGLLTETADRLQATIKTEINSAGKRLATRFETRLKETKQSLRQEMQQETRRQDKLFETLFTNILKYELGKQTDWMTRQFNVLAQQLKQTHTVVAHALAKQTDLEARVEKLEEQVSRPL
jgi:hypothetical protein